ncbi:diacylglycerol kinase family protein [Virgibacillus sediminis]|uniref:Diacylglycerol kinase family protein n=1 Tax=Virgibacillus sediminis TaxID=202260 RepID=A0ABV7A628_9BACI
MSSVWNDNKKGIGFSHAWAGIRQTLKTEMNFRFHLAAGCIVIFSGFLFKVTRFEWMALILSIGLVLASEIINTAIEKMVDYIKPDIHPSAKAIKDMAAGMVMISAATAAIIGLIVFVPRIGVLLQ